jgi:hypothetical protein
LDRFFEAVPKLVKLCESVIKDVFSTNFGLVPCKHGLYGRMAIDHLPHRSLGHRCAPEIGINKPTSAAMLVMVNKLPEDLDSGGEWDEERHVSQNLEPRCNGSQDPAASNSLLLATHGLDSDGLLRVPSSGQTKGHVRFFFFYGVGPIIVLGPSLELMPFFFLCDDRWYESFHVKSTGHEPVVFRQELPSRTERNTVSTCDICC